MTAPSINTLQDKIRGSLIGGAVGDALGAPVEFMSLADNKRTYGADGITAYASAYGRLGAITDDTQMTLFTAEGLLQAYIRANLRGMVSIPSVLSLAYLRWLHTQGLMQKGPHNSVSLTGWLVREGALFSRRAPGHTCISALTELNGATSKRADNDSKGAGGIMRIAPVAMMYANEPDQEAVVFRVAKEAAWITHGHPSGYLAAGGFAVILHGLFCGRSLQQSIFAAQHILIAQSDAAEVLQHIDRALVLADRTDRDPEQDIAELGEGWVAEEALAIALYCGLSSKDFSSGICMAVNLEGDSDTTGSLVGQLLGATCGYANIPVRWTEELELRAVILQLADDISAHEKWNLDYMDQARYDDAIVQRYMD